MADNALAGRAVTGTRTRGWPRVQINGRHYRVAYVVWRLTTGEWPHFLLTPINGDWSDTRFENLCPGCPVWSTSHLEGLWKS